MTYMDADNAIKRRERTLKKLEQLGIDYCDNLPLIGGYKLCKSEKRICKRFIASLFFAFQASDYLQDSDIFATEGRERTEKAVETFKLKKYLFADETKMLNGECNERIATDASWGIECCYALAWALGFVSTEDMEMANDLAEPQELLEIVSPFHAFKDFKASCKIRHKSEVMDMLDLYYNYHWACDDHRTRPATKCGELNEGVVMERRKALEWLVAKDKDWDDIFLDT